MRRVVVIAVLAALTVTAAAFADDGVLFVKNIPKTPELESDKAKLELLKLYVPAQDTDGALLRDTDDGGIVYAYKDDLYPAFTREYAKPLVSFYTDGHVEFVEIAPGFGGHGERDIFGAVSLDDGATWKRTNLSDSAGFSSINIGGEAYPGDVVYIFSTSGGNKVLAVWASRFCQGGSPVYAIDPDDLGVEYDALVELGRAGLVRLPDGCTDTTDSPCLYLDDLFAVSGSQRSFDLGDEGFPEVGELPYSCLWAARGTVEPVAFDAEGGMTYDPTGSTEQHGVIWRQAERLTSGRRDVNRIEAAAVPGAGFVVTWQEDPDGLRPGMGEGPGAGFSGAIAHNKTDVWYSYLPWEAFDWVDDGDGLYGNPLTLEEYFALNTEGPKVGFPFSIPVRLTDNNKCDTGLIDPDTGELKAPYCHVDFDGNLIPDFCVEAVIVPTNTGETEVCIAEDGRMMRGNVAATRPRTNLHGYDSDGDGLNDRAWVVMASEESKGLGDEGDEEIDKVDMGKNAFYYTFDMFDPEIVSQGLQLNQPAIYPDWAKTSVGDEFVEWEEYDFGEDQWLAIIKFDPIYCLADPAACLGATLYQTQIARRTSLITQPAAKAGGSGGVGLITWKEGIIQRGGPADVLARRVVIPADFDPMVDNPFDYRNVQCADLAFADGTNPRYVKGLCKAPPLNLSGTSIVACSDNTGSPMDPEACAASFPWNERFDDYDSSDEESYFAWLTFWRMCEEGVELDGFTCPDSDLDDPTWENPFDLSKGHRGFFDGDFVMLLYAWSPNWKANRVGHDNYNLYVRRSFDGGVTWTTTPATLGGGGTAHCETYRDGDKGDPDSEDTTICFSYGAGDFEQARDLSRFQTVHLTVLDPRYTPTDSTVYHEGALLYPDDERDRSKYVVSYETGDNTTTAVGEPEPLDMFYGRAYHWGDHYELFETDELDPTLSIECAEDDLLDITNLCGFDWLEHHNDLASSEATLRANSAGDFFYAVWSESSEVVEASDISFRRIMWYFDGDGGTGQDGIDRVFNLSVNVAGAGSGSVYGDYLGFPIITCGSAGSDCQETLAEGVVCDLWAVPDVGDIFEGWQGDVVSTDSYLQIPMTEDWTLTAIFQPGYVCQYDDLVLTDMLCTAHDEFIACNTILVQGTSVVTETGILDLLVGDQVTIDNGFRVENGGRLKVEIWPHLQE